MKYSPLGNNNLEDFLLSEGAEVVVPGLLDFCMYCVYNGLVDQWLYGGKFVKYQGSRIAYRYLLKKQKDVIAAIKRQGVFQSQTPFDKTVTLCDPYINHGVKMGEGVAPHLGDSGAHRRGRPERGLHPALRLPCPITSWPRG